MNGTTKRRATRQRSAGRAWFSMPSGWFAGPVNDGPPCPICRRPMFRGEIGYVCGAPGEMHGKIHQPAR